MKLLKLLNNKYLSIIIIFSFSSIFAIAEDQPIDIWNIDKKSIEAESELNTSDEKIKPKTESNIYDMQANKKKDSIKLDQALVSKETKIIGLYDPEDYGLSINMWSNSDGLKLKNLFENIDKFDLSNDASEILDISLLTNAYYPNQNITEEEFLEL